MEHPETLMIKILIADDHALFREGLRAVLTDASECEIVGEAADGEAAVLQAEALSPDVILMDIHMPKRNGIDATARVLKARPNTGIIALTMLEDDASVLAMMRAGARGYVLKGADKAELLKTIYAVAAGEARFGPAIASRIAALFVQAPKLNQPFPELTTREREILALIAEGHNNTLISERLSISTKTLGNHISSIFGKIQAEDRAHAIVKAREAGMSG